MKIKFGQVRKGMTLSNTRDSVSPESQKGRPSQLVSPALGSVTCRLVLLSEKGELKKPLTMFMTDSVTHLSRKVSACFLSVVVLQTWRESQVSALRVSSGTFSTLPSESSPQPFLCSMMLLQMDGF